VTSFIHLLLTGQPRIQPPAAELGCRRAIRHARGGDSHTLISPWRRPASTIDRDVQLTTDADDDDDDFAVIDLNDSGWLLLLLLLLLLLVAMF